METFYLNSWFPGKDFNPVSAYYEAGMLRIAARHAL
jgi:hypothetical protein